MQIKALAFICKNPCYIIKPSPDFQLVRADSHQRTSFTFLTKTKLSRQVRDILKKTKGVIISTIALHLVLASLCISRHGHLVQTSNNQAGPRGEICI